MDESRTADAPAINQATASRIPVRSISLAIVVTVVLYVGMATLADWEAFGAAVSALPSALWMQVVALSLLSYLLRFVRWHHFIVALGHKVPILRNLEIYLAAFALTLTPGKAGETIRSVYSERLLDLVAVGALASLAVSMFPEQRPWMLAAIACIVTVVLLLRSWLLSLIGKRLARGSVVSHAAKAVATVRFLLSGRRLAVAAPLSLMAWMAQGVSLYLIVHALGYEITGKHSRGDLLPEHLGRCCVVYSRWAGGNRSRNRVTSIGSRRWSDGRHHRITHQPESHAVACGWYWRCGDDKNRSCQSTAVLDTRVRGDLLWQ